MKNKNYRSNRKGNYILYNSSKFQLVNDNISELTYPNELYILNNQTSKWMISDDQNPTQPIDISLYYVFLRLPFSGVFESIDRTLKIFPIFSHNDSPGMVKGEISLNGMGAKEFFWN